MSPRREWRKESAASWVSPFEKSRRHRFRQILDRRGGAALGMRQLQRLKADLDRAQGAEHHRRVDVAHMRDAETPAFRLAQSAAEHDTAFLAQVIDQRLR